MTPEQERERERDRDRLDTFADGWDAGRRDLLARWGTHYDTLPHGNCYDPIHCDCECRGCAPVKVRRAPGAMSARETDDCPKR